MRSKPFYLSSLAAPSVIALLVLTGCQKKKSAEAEIPDATTSTAMPATDSAMMSGNIMMSDSSMKMTGSAGKGMMTDSMSIRYYTCPMHPEVHEAKPGKCPICGMNLVLHKADKTAR